MCGRFTQLYSWPELVALYRLTMPPMNLQPSYNICPTDPVHVLCLRRAAAVISFACAGAWSPVGGRSR
jgi:putative SOS response-associated peptidase YedK